MDREQLYKFRTNDLKIIREREDNSVIEYTKLYHQKIKNNKTEYKNELILYKNVLSKAKDIAFNLGIDNNPISYSIILSYMIWNGYLSCNKRFRFNSSDKNSFKDLAGLESFDVILGEGCCRHLTPLLDDILTELEVDCKDIINYTVPKIPLKKVKINIERFDEENYPFETYFLYDEKEEEPPLGDHMSTLLIQNDNYYVYDITNLLLFKVDKLDDEQLIGTMYDGVGYTKLKIYSVMQKYNLSFQETRELLKKIDSQNYSSFISLSEYQAIVRYSNNICNKNKDIFEEFHLCVKDDLKDIKEKVLFKK